MQYASRYQPDQRSQYLRSASASVLPANTLSAPISAGYETASSTQSVHSNSTSKLPHGLTVHELKEMTKARLQAEAAEKLSSFGDKPPVSEIMENKEVVGSTLPADGIPSDFNSGFSQEIRPSGHGSDSGSSHAHVHSPPLNDMDQNPGSRQLPQGSSLTPALQAYRPDLPFDETTVQDHSGVLIGNRNRVNSCPEANWETSSMSSNTYRPTLSPFNENFMQDQNRSVGNRCRINSCPEASWESGSVTSHNSTAASEYLGSESAFPSGMGFTAGDDGTGVPFGRTLSYPAGSSRVAGGSETPSRENTPTSAPSPLDSYFDPAAGMAQNRQRAMTLSPRPGLSQLHEDRPGFADEGLGMPTFSSSRHSRQQPAGRSRVNLSPVVQPQSFSVDNFSSFGGKMAGVIGGGIFENRPRTSSAVSLPAISHTAEELGIGSDYTGADPSRRSSDGSHTREDVSQSLAADSFLGSSSLYSSEETATRTTSGSVFRNNLGGVPAPPGLAPASDNCLNSLSAPGPLSSRMGGMEDFGDNRARAATWVAGGDVFGAASRLYDFSGDDTLAGDLASILKLSGAEEKNDGDRSGTVGPGAFVAGRNDFKENDSCSQLF
jgi:hypothetical protein